MQPLLNVALRATRKAGENLVRATERFDLNSATDTELHKFLADCSFETEKNIIFDLRKAYPEHSFQGRETGLSKAEVNENNPNQDEYLWLISPMEGSDNFATGLPQYAITLACYRGGRVEHSLILNPVSGEEFSASRGRGAHYNGRRIRTNDKTRLSDSKIGVNYPGLADTESNKVLRTMVNNLTAQTHGVRALGCNALSLAYTAAGHLDGCWLSNLSDYALAAGTLMTQEAGCLSADFSGGGETDAKREVVAGNARIFKAILQTINQ
jgi:myo-inositol-1(or 4)-monophosphatase